MVEAMGSGGTFDELITARGIATIKIGSSLYALVTTSLNNAVQIINITNPASPTAVSSITEGDDGFGGTFDELAGASGISTIKLVHLCTP